MKIITYNQGLELKVNKFTSGQFKWAFSLTFNNGVHTFCYTMTELRTILLKNGMTRKWAANVKGRFDPTTDEHVLINRYRTSGGSEMEVFITSRIPFVNMVGTGLGMGYMKFQLLEHKFKPTIVKKEFNWELPADPDPKSDNYYNGIVSRELGGLQQYRGDPPWGYPQRVSQESV